MEMENQVKIIRASLQGAQIATRSVDADAFIRIAGEMINHNPDALYPTERELDPLKDLNYQCVDDTFDLKVKADYMTLGLAGVAQCGENRASDLEAEGGRCLP